MTVPLGVTINGNAGKGLNTALFGAPNQIGLVLRGSATISEVSAVGFGVGVEASRGTQSLEGLHFTGGGIRLTGTANTTLNGAVHLDPGFPVARGQTIFKAPAGAAISVNNQAQFTMNGGDLFSTTRLGDGQANCDTTQQGIVASGSARVTINTVLFDNLAGGALDLHGASEATVDGSKIFSEYDSDQCAPPDALRTLDTASLKLTNSDIESNNQGVLGFTDGIAALGAVPLELDSTQVAGFNGTGIISGPDTNVLINLSGLLGDSSAGLDASATRFANVQVTNSDVEGANDGFGIIAQNLTLRDTTVIGNITGVAITGPYANLGTLSSPGANTFEDSTPQPNVTTSVRFSPGVTGVIDAVGNLWQPGEQGANAFGFYLNPVTITSADPDAMGQNFQLTSPGQSINLGPLVGLAKVTPRLLHVTAGHSARLKVSWTHPRSWRDLRSIQVRLYRGAEVIAQRTIDPRRPRLGGTGALRLLKVTRAGKTVTANMLLHTLSSLAGQTLRVAVQATDSHGQRQLDPAAGTIHITRSAT